MEYEVMYEDGYMVIKIDGNVEFMQSMSYEYYLKILPYFKQKD